jgi:flagellar basal-body rod protein FlgG
MKDDGMYLFPIGSVDTAPIVGKIGTGVELNELYTVFTQGAMKETGNFFDLALEGKGFFSVATPEGEKYTRNGSFTLGKEGLLLTGEGFPVMGENGPIAIKKNNFVVDQDGRVFQNGTFSGDPERLVSLEENEWENLEYVDRLRLVDFEETRYLRKQGNSLWQDTYESGSAVPITQEGLIKVRQGFLESANVNPVTEMVKMIEVNRAYEANQKSIQTHESLAGRLINETVKV